jgi:TatD DNase family protein
MLVETDAPFLAPMPHRGLLNSPAQIPNTLRFMAEVVQRNVNELAIATRENALTIFGAFE